jgi:hypothetical protein
VWLSRARTTRKHSEPHAGTLEALCLDVILSAQLETVDFRVDADSGETQALGELMGTSSAFVAQLETTGSCK